MRVFGKILEGGMRYNEDMDEAKEEIRERLAVEDVIGQYLELKRAGKNLKAHSPWGADKTPSFMVSPEKGIWHDFSSNKGGDIFTFIMEIEGISFREALEKLAAQAGVELKKYSGGDEKVALRKRRMREALELACRYYQVCLTKNKPVMEYVFYKRNLNKKTVEKFRIGYAPMGGRALVDFLSKRGFTKMEMEDAGLLNRFGGDLFKGRMMVPLMDSGGVVIGFTGRILAKDENSPKYLNTPETMLYNKGRHIFGLSQAKEAIHKSGFCVVVEGNMDVISSHQAGLCEAVATAGTAMTEMHLKVLSRLTNDIRLAYDGDEAGVSAAERAIGMASKLGIFLTVVDDYHGCKDADELIQKDPELWRVAVDKACPALEWLLAKYEDKYDLRTERGFKEYSDVAKRLIGEIEDVTLRERYEKMVANKLGVELETFRKKQLDTKVRKLKKINFERMVVKDEATVAEKSLGALVRYGGYKLDDIALPDDLNDAELALIFEQKYGAWSAEKIQNEGDDLRRRVCLEHYESEKKTLQLKLAEAEGVGDELVAEELLSEIAILNRKIKENKK